ncbi:family 78 glycoside hydrolase catalytic domain [Luteolibacter sp. LG18]|uniref:family 78 glycoside hydrolase catalytic domain n=1 Tax=Luteolibacter sp. LG18 TaxID=2819286 RepID=UPI002B2A7518|nr:alpha-L-rhamnosidase [Luteolibacter sp. LG18]
MPVLAEPAHSLAVNEGFENPLGFHDPAPRFSWKLPVGVKQQKAYRIEANTPGKGWDSGWVESGDSTLVPYGGTPLASREAMTWRVNFRDESGTEYGWSAPARCEIGLLSNDDWKARWIRPSQPCDAAKEPVGLLRKKFPVAKEVSSARVYVTARGLFELELNGNRVGSDHFANGWTSYRKRLDTLSYDVTGLLKSGGNTIQAMLGTGWYAGRVAWGKNQKGQYGKLAELLLQLEVSYKDGSKEMIVSDGGWEGTFDGPVVSSSLYDGEDYDARRQPSNWAPVVADANLGSARLTPKPFLPVREDQTLGVKRITEPKAGCQVFDLGQNMVGWARLRIPVEKDKTITVRFAEMLNADGTLYTENYRSARSTDTYTSAETGTITWEPRFTFHGFRYVELSGLPAGVQPREDWVTGVVLHSDLRPIGGFTSSHAKLNQLQSNIVWGQRGNFLDVPTDCPQRDERLGWTGDAQAFCQTAMFNYDCLAFLKSWLGSMRDDQQPDGRLPHVVPGVVSESGSPGWMDAATIVPWEAYIRTGDREMLEQNYPMMEKLVAWYGSQAVDGLLPGIKGYGDWLQPHAKGLKGDTPFPLLGAAYYAHSLQILANASVVLGRGDDAVRYAALADQVRGAFTNQYFDNDGKLKNAPETQTAYVLAIAFDLIPRELRSGAGANLDRLIREAGGHLRTGFLGTPLIARALDETGRSETACELLFQESYPSWFYPINQGATTMWERWNSYSLEKGFGDAKMNSFNHYAYGAIGQWMYERVAGLSPDPANPGYRHFFVRPLVCKQLDSARAELETPYGKAVSSWVKRDGWVELEVEVPPNTTATIEFPGDRKPLTVPAGSYRYDAGL